MSARPRVGILASGDRWHVERLSEALHGAGCSSVPLPAARLCGWTGPGAFGRGVRAADAEIEDFDALLVRYIPPGSLDQIVLRIDLLHVLHDAGRTVMNTPRALERTVDKFWTTRRLHEAGLPTPRTVAAEGFDEAMRAFHELGGDVLVKPLLGSGGRGIARVEDADVAYRVFRTLEMQRAAFYVQEFVPHGTSDLRLLVAGTRVAAAARRTGNGWKTNVAAGAVMRPHRPDALETHLALRAARAVGADYAGVDLLETPDGGRVVVEVNGIPGWRALQEATGVDLATDIVAVLRDRLARGPADAAAATE